MSSRTKNRIRKQNEAAASMPLQKSRSAQDVRKIFASLPMQLCDAAARGDLTELQKLINGGAQALIK